MNPSPTNNRVVDSFELVDGMLLLLLVSRIREWPRVGPQALHKLHEGPPTRFTDSKTARGRRASGRAAHVSPT